MVYYATRTSEGTASLPISILSTQESDIPVLARIAATSMAVDLLHRAIYPSNDPLDLTPQQTNQERELQRAFRNPDARVFKAVIKDTDEIVGYALFRVEGHDEGEGNGRGEVGPGGSLATAAVVADVASSTVDGVSDQMAQQAQKAQPVAPSPTFPSGTNVELMSRLWKEVRAVHARVMGDKRHICSSYAF